MAVLGSGLSHWAACDTYVPYQSVGSSLDYRVLLVQLPC